jgi:hypothetical protein
LILHEFSRSHFEDLSNEIIYDILDFLDGCHAYEAFSNLNARFDRLLQWPSRLLKINLVFSSKGAFEHRCKTILASNIDRIISLHLSTVLSIHLFLKLFSINSFIRLESLTLDSIQSDDLDSLLLTLTFLPRLFSLSIMTVDCLKDENLTFGLIFNLPVLKYVKCWFPTRVRFDGSRFYGFPRRAIGQQQNETIRHLITNQDCYLDQLGVLSCIPKLHRLSCKRGCKDVNIRAEVLMIPTDLTHISINEGCRLLFDQFELFISKLCPQLQMLRIQKDDDNDYLDADRWQHLILQHMPKLRIFDIDCQCVVASDDQKYRAYHAVIDRFSSPFWLERQWYFAHQHSGIFPYRYAKFYSIQPYRYRNRISQNCKIHLIFQKARI